MGALLSSAFDQESADLEPLVAWLSAELGLTPSARLQPVIREWLESGTVARSIAAEGANTPPASSEEASTPPASSEIVDVDLFINTIAPALLAHDSALADARRRLVPAMPVKKFWELTAAHLLTRARAELPLLLRRDAARDALRRQRATWAAAWREPAPALHQLDDGALLAVAAALPDAAALLALGATCRALYPLAHADAAWLLRFRLDFVDAAPPADGCRAAYEAVATSGGRVPPASPTRHAHLSATWGSPSVKYAGWGAAHLEVAVLWRTASAVGVRATFEYMLDSDEYVWGGRATEELRLAAVDPRRGEWGEPTPLTMRGAAAVLAEHGLREADGGLEEMLDLG